MIFNFFQTKKETTKKPESTNLYNYSEILASEFDHISGTMFQLDESRSRASEFFVLVLGSILALVFSEELPLFEDDPIILIIIFISVGLMGLLTLLNLAKLRISWREGIKAMSTLKNALFSENPELINCFKWNQSTLPKAFKIKSVGMITALQVSIFTSLSFTIAYLYIQKRINSEFYYTNKIILHISIAIALILLSLFFFYILPLLIHGNAEKTN